MTGYLALNCLSLVVEVVELSLLVDRVSSEGVTSNDVSSVSELDEMCWWLESREKNLVPGLHMLGSGCSIILVVYG